MSYIKWVWPVPGVSKVTSYFGPRVHPIKGGSSTHKGIDIGAPLNTPIVSIADGKVISSGSAKGYGHWIRIDHGSGYISIYGHMYANQLKVNVGDIVSAGQVIAGVGSDGESTGNHLHLQLELNGEAIDPLKYIKYDQESNIPVDYIDGNDESISDITSSYANAIVQAAGSTIGQRVSGVTPQPVHAFINIWLGPPGEGGKLLATDPAKPNIIQSFEYHRQEPDGASGESALFVVFDDNWEDIELALSKHWDDIYIQYGYYGTGMKSKIVHHILQDYSISFEATGTILSVSTITDGIYLNLKQITIAEDRATRNPTGAVKMICEDIGLIVEDENFEQSKSVSEPFVINNENPITYIQQQIIPLASETNEEVFTFRVDNENKAYFKRQKFDDTRTDTLRTYIFQKGYDSSVIDFTADVKGVFGGSGSLHLATGYHASVFDPDTKEENTAYVDKSTAVENSEAEGNHLHTHPDQSVQVASVAGLKPEEAAKTLYYRVKARYADSYGATLTIVGDPTIDYITPGERYIRVINMTDRGHLHHTSGVYFIQEIIDSIDGGRMTTTLKLSRYATGDMEGVEVINPNKNTTTN